MTEDVQRDMEQRSLRNVRALLDKLEGEAEVERRTRRWIAVGLVVATVVVFGVLFLFYVTSGTKIQSRTVVIQPARPATLPEPAPK
jgi:hypothetical protein